MVATSLANSPRRDCQSRNISREIARRDEIDQTHRQCGPPNAIVRLRIASPTTFQGPFRELSKELSKNVQGLTEGRGLIHTIGGGAVETSNHAPIPASRATIWYRIGQGRLAARLGATGSVDEKALV